MIQRAASLPAAPAAGFASAPPGIASSSAVAPPKPSAAHTPELDGFRAIAVWSVMLMHTFIAFPDYVPGVLPVLVSPVQFGWLGVDLFFVLSGFLITGILLDSRGKPRYFRNFYGRRVLRIMPLYFVMVSVVAVLYRGYRSYFVLATAFMANYAIAFGVREPHGPGVLWSLAVEEQFYLLWPLVVLMCGRRRVMWVAGGIVVLTPILRALWRAHGGDVIMMYDFSWFRFDGLALGAFLAAWIRVPGMSARRSIGLVMALVAISVIVTVAALPYGVFTTFSVASGALRFTQVNLVFAAGILLAFTLRGTRWTAPLRSRVAILSSDFSYCIYLTHVCIIDGWWWVEGRYGLRPAGVSYVSWALVRTVVVVSLAFMIAAVSRRYLEDPCLRLKRYFT